MLIGTQRRMLIKVISAYCTISADAANVIARITTNMEKECERNKTIRKEESKIVGELCEKVNERK